MRVSLHHFDSISSSLKRFVSLINRRQRVGGTFVSFLDCTIRSFFLYSLFSFFLGRRMISHRERKAPIICPLRKPIDYFLRYVDDDDGERERERGTRDLVEHYFSFLLERL